MESWGWRVPFFAGSLIGLVALGIRARVPETPLFEKLQSRGKTVRTPLRESLRGQPRHPSHIRASWLQRALLLPCYRLRATYLVSFVKIEHATAMHIATVASTFNVAFIGIPAWFSDIVGRKPLLIIGSLGFLILTYPLYILLSRGSIASMT